MLGEALGYLMEQHARLAFLDRDAAALPPPPCVKDILIDRVVGEGGQGTVYAGRWLGIHVAIKVRSHHTISRDLPQSPHTRRSQGDGGEGGRCQLAASSQARRIPLCSPCIGCALSPPTPPPRPSQVTRGRDTGRRLQDEARLLARLRHPSVCTLFGATVLSDGGGALVPALTTARRVMLSK